MESSSVGTIARGETFQIFLLAFSGYSTNLIG